MFIINRSRDRLPLKCIIYDEYTNYNNALDFEKDSSSSSLSSSLSSSSSSSATSLTKSPQCNPHDLYNFLLIREGRKLKRIKADYALKIGLFKTTQSAASVLLSQCPPPTSLGDGERHGPKHSPREFGSGMLGEISFSERIKDARVMISILNTEYVPKSGGYRWIGEAGRIPSELLISVVYGAYKLIRAEPSLIELKSPVAIFGDVFGNYRDLRKFTDILKIEEDQPRNFLFLGSNLFYILLYIIIIIYIRKKDLLLYIFPTYMEKLHIFKLFFCSHYYLFMLIYFQFHVIIDINIHIQ